MQGIPQILVVALIMYILVLASYNTFKYFYNGRREFIINSKTIVEWLAGLVVDPINYILLAISFGIAYHSLGLKKSSLLRENTWNMIRGEAPF